MVPPIRLRSLRQWCEFHSESTASFVECGIAKGGCTALMTFLSNDNKTIWGFDSFEGMPELTSEDNDSGKRWVGYVCSGTDGEQAVSKSFEKLGISMDKANIVKGYFENTLEAHKDEIGPISILRLDNDWYKSTYYCLEMLYDNVIDTGIIIIDDYGLFTGCKKAVDLFREERNITDPLIRTDSEEYYWQKR